MTHPDVCQRWLEIELVKRYLKADERVLDVGCGAGYATKMFAPLVREIVGVDASQGMIDRALAASETLPANARFAAADVLQLKAAERDLFDLAISVRCLINLADWEQQKLALTNIAGVIRPGGRFLMVEGSVMGREGLNRLRESLGLGRMPTVWHNRDFDLGELMPFLRSHFEVLEERDLGVYDLLSRVAHPLLVAPESPRYEAKVNEIAARMALEQFGLPEISRVLFLVLRRPS